MAINKVEICGVNTSKLPILSNQQKEQLFSLIEAGDNRAREEYIYGNLRLVLSVIQRFNNRGEHVDDKYSIVSLTISKLMHYSSLILTYKY